MKKTAKEIANQVAALKAIKPKVRQFSAFGDDHHNSIGNNILAESGGVCSSDGDRAAVDEDGEGDRAPSGGVR